MKENIRKVKIISKIADEVTSFYLENGAQKFQIQIDKNEDTKEYTIYAFGYTKLSRREVEDLKQSMVVHHDLEYEVFWELMGGGESTDELVLLGRICDSVHINYENGILELILKKTV